MFRFWFCCKIYVENQNREFTNGGGGAGGGGGCHFQYFFNGSPSDEKIYVHLTRIIILHFCRFYDLCNSSLEFFFQHEGYDMHIVVWFHKLVISLLVIYKRLMLKCWHVGVKMAFWKRRYAPTHVIWVIYNWSLSAPWVCFGPIEAHHGVESSCWS